MHQSPYPRSQLILKLKIPVVGVQGSMQLMGVSREGKPRLRYPSTTVEARNYVISAIAQKWGGRDPLTGPIAVDVLFEPARPKYHWGTGRNKGVLKPSAPLHMTTTPDFVDKGLRLVLDALTIAGVYDDDSQVVSAFSNKQYSRKKQPRTTLRVYDLSQEAS